MIKDSKRLTILIMLSVFILANVCCIRHSNARQKMDEAEEIMNSRPEAALEILDSIKPANLDDKEERARYALLKSMALDKNCIDTTTFDVLQPALDYYPKNGTGDNILRTLYYQGRIFMNKSDLDKAMLCFLKAKDLKGHYSDTLIFANLLVAQGSLYYQSYQIEDFIQNNLEAALLYGKLRKERMRQSSLIKALDGMIGIKNKHKADSIMSITDSLVKFVPDTQEMLALVKLTYGIVFESNNSIKNVIDTITDFEKLDDEVKLNISLGYLRLHEIDNATYIFDLIDSTGQIAQTHKYLAVKSDILISNGKYQDAIISLKKYYTAIEEENAKIYSQKTTVALEQHKLEIKHLNALQKKDQQLWLGLCIVLILIIIIGIIHYQLRLGNKNRIISEQEQYRLQLENENLQKQNSVLELERHNANLELEKKILAAENMQIKISQLESECERLKELVDGSQLSNPILKSIQERIGILNGLLAAKISDNDSYSKPYDKWINEVTEDRKSFMDSTRLAFRASHPMFLKYLDEHGLSEAEINYVCLYAIGLRGKEIGEYMKLKRHYHMSTDIRKKLGLHERDTNLGLHIRNLMNKL